MGDIVGKAPVYVRFPDDVSALVAEVYEDIQARSSAQILPKAGLVGFEVAMLFHLCGDS